MKIGFFTDSYLPRLDGVAVSVEACVRALRARGHEVFVIAPREPRYRDNGKDIYRLASVKFPSTKGTPEARWTLQLPEKTLLQVLKIDFDVIHGHSTLSGITFLGFQIAKVQNIPYVATYHTLWNRYTHYIFNGKIVTPKMIEFASKVVGNLCDFLIVPTERVKKELISYGVKKPINILPTGIDLDNYKNIKKGFIRNKIKISDQTKILLYVGRLGKEKSVDFLIHAFKIINQKNSNTTLVYVGEGPEEAALKKLAKELNVDKNVYFLGSVKHEDVPKIYGDADIFVFASQTETQGLVVLEALASGIPVIAVDDPAFKNVVDNGKNGYLVKHNINTFSEKVLLLLGNETIYKNFSESALMSVRKFAIDNTAMYLEKLYEKVINEKKQKEKNSIPTKSVKSIKEFLIKANRLLNKLYE